ncbi:lysophospholipid acyltransferase 5-like [Diorhabda carinulata]|uniref:lysophospholipid acyltransferase 5-like n=1 Tax=Diorhabda carinulata TaxID=1163345 RepID=UPI0025A23ACF|nr:lysophospholipid acyltransferase 5-like [Diorhabda carinulata]
MPPSRHYFFFLIAGYILAFVHRKYIYNKESSLQHLFFITSGFSIGYWNYGNDIFHCVFTIFCTHCSFMLLQGSTINVAIVFIFNMMYLITGYIYTSTESYDITWTMPQCVITLRLIAIAFDLYDGRKPIEKLSHESKKLALVKRPSILEIYGHSFFPSSFLVGPQISMRRYNDFVDGKFNSKNGPPDSVSASLKSLILGFLYSIIYQKLGTIVSNDYLLSEEFGQKSFFIRMVLLGVWGKYTLYKYIAIWLLTEGSCTLFGITHNGLNEKGLVKWDALSNVNLLTFEGSLGIKDFVKSFNLTTNAWLAQYIYKRVKFLGSKHASQFVSLFFLGIWHGYHEGYYVCFLFEFGTMVMEADIQTVINSDESLNRFFSISIVQILAKILRWIYTFLMTAWCWTSFVLLKYNKFRIAYANLNYIGVKMFLFWILIYGPFLRLMAKTMSRKNK